MNKIFYYIVLSITLIFISCSDPALEVEYGKTLIYMPQATHNLGTDCNLNVQLSPSAKSDTVVTIGVYRSGLQKLEEFSVSLNLNVDTIAKAKVIAEDPFAEEKYLMYKTAQLLPGEYYESLPELLTVPKGSREATFGLKLKKEEILESFKKDDIFLLPIQISNPTRYEINKALSLTMVVITIK